MLRHRTFRHSGVMAVSLLASSCATTAATPVGYSMPDGWTARSEAELSFARRRNFVALMHCHEPDAEGDTPAVNTSLGIDSLRSGRRRTALNLIQNNVKQWQIRYPKMRASGVVPSRLAGRRSYFAKAKLSIERNGVSFPVTNQWWVVPVDDRNILLLAQQPDPPDPSCSAELEELIDSLHFGEPAD